MTLQNGIHSTLKDFKNPDPSGRLLENNSIPLEVHQVVVLSVASVAHVMTSFLWYIMMVPGTRYATTDSVSTLCCLLIGLHSCRLDRIMCLQFCCITMFTLLLPVVI